MKKAITYNFKNQEVFDNRVSQFVKQICSVEYQKTIEFLTQVLNSYFNGVEFQTTRRINFPNGKQIVKNILANGNSSFGSIWEEEATELLKSISGDTFRPWPCGKVNFPDAEINGIKIDFKACATTLNKDGNINFNGACDLMKQQDFLQEYSEYAISGKLTDHLQAIMVYAIYQVTPQGNAKILKVVCCPAVLTVRISKYNQYNSKTVIPYFRSGKATIGFLTQMFNPDIDYNEVLTDAVKNYISNIRQNQVKMEV